MREETARAVGDLKKMFQSCISFLEATIFQQKQKWHSGYSCKVKAYGTWFDFLQILFFYKNYSDPPKKAELIRANLLEMFNICIY